jgi:hypothetical protein
VEEISGKVSGNYSKSNVFCFEVSSQNDVTPALKGILTPVGKIANFEREKVHEDQIFEL